MDFIDIKVTSRQPARKQGARRLRQAGQIPAIVYGKRLEPQPIAIEGRSFKLHVERGGRLYRFDVDGQTQQCMLKDVQWDTFGLEILHADLTRVDEGDRLQINVPVRILQANQVDLGGDTMLVAMRTVPIEASVQHLPDSLSLDVSGLSLEQPKLTGDIEMPEGVRLACQPDEIVVQIVARAKATGAELAAEEAEGAEGEETPAAEGEAGAEGTTGDEKASGGDEG